MLLFLLNKLSKAFKVLPIHNLFIFSTLDLHIKEFDVLTGKTAFVFFTSLRRAGEVI